MTKLIYAVRNLDTGYPSVEVMTGRRHRAGWEASQMPVILFLQVAASDMSMVTWKHSIDERHYDSRVVEEHSSGIGMPAFESLYHLLVTTLGKLFNFSVLPFFIYKICLICTS